MIVYTKTVAGMNTQVPSTSTGESMWYRGALQLLRAGRFVHEMNVERHGLVSLRLTHIHTSP
jgi:hypothetical protein